MKIEIIKMTYAKQDTNAIEKTQTKNQSGMIKTLLFFRNFLNPQLKLFHM
jgi:hypothetical protein